MTTFRERVEAFIGEMYGVSRMPIPMGDDHIECALSALIYDVSGISALEKMGGKTLHNSDVSGAKKNVPDIKTFGNGDAWQLICKASSEREGWMKSTKAMQVQGGGCLVQVTTQQRNPDGSYAVAEAVTYVPDVHVMSDHAVHDGPPMDAIASEAAEIMAPGSNVIVGRHLQRNLPK